MALPAPVQQPGFVQERREQVELGTIGVSLATQPQAWPLSVASSLLDAYRVRELQLPDLDVIASSRTVECHCTPDLLNQKVYAPFKVIQNTLPTNLLNAISNTKSSKVGYLPGIDTIWTASTTTTLFWDLSDNTVKEFSFQSQVPVVDVAYLLPDKRVFNEEVKHLLAVSTTKEMRLYAVGKNHEFFDTELAISIEGLGQPLVRGSGAGGRIFFSADKTGTSIWEFKYAAKETWFTPKVQRVCHGEYGGIFGGLFGSSVSKPGAETILDFVIDDSTSTLFALTSKSAIHVYEFSPEGTSISLTKNISSAQARSALFFGVNNKSLDQNLTFIAISAVPLDSSKYIRLVAITDTGSRVYFRAQDWRRTASQIQPVYMQRPPVPEDKSEGEQDGRVGLAKDVKLAPKLAAVVNGRISYAVTTDNRVLASTVDDARVAHQCDLRQPVSFVELSGWLNVDGPVLHIGHAGVNDLVLTETSLYKIKRRPFSERFEYPDAPFALAQVYGPMQLCCGALQLAAQSSTRSTRENAVGAFFRFGGLPMFRRDQLQTGFLGHASIRLSSSFDGLALYIAKLLAPLWTSKILGPNDKPPNFQLLDGIYAELSGLVELLDQNRSFSEGMSERSNGYSAGDDAALLSQGEYKGLQALGRLAKSSQEGIAFLKLILSQSDTRLLLSYFDESRMNKFRQLTFGEFFTAAKNSDVARELVNCLVNYVLNKGDSVDVITSIIQDRCSSYCSTGDVLEYKALEFIHHAKQNKKHVDSASLARSVALIRRAASTIQLETLRDVVRDYAHLKYFSGAVQASLAVAAEQDPANLAVGYLRQRTSSNAAATDDKSEPPSKRLGTSQDSGSHAAANSNGSQSGAGGAIPAGTSKAVARPISESELKFRAKMEVYDILFSEVLNSYPEIASANSSDPAHALMLKSTDEVWHFALYDWYLEHNQQDQVALLDTPFVANYLQLGASHDLRIANLLWKWHQRHGDLLAAADVLLDLARGPLVHTLSQRVEFLSRAMGYCQAQPQHTQQAVNMTTMVRAYLGLALIQTEILSKLSNIDTAGKNNSNYEQQEEELNTHLFTVSELFNDWAEPNGLYDICFAIFEFSDFRDPLEIRQCWSNLLTKTRIEDDREKVSHHAHLASMITQLGSRYKSSESIFSVSDLVPMLEQYAVDYTRSAPPGWIIDALVNAGIDYNVLHKVYTEVLQNRLLEGEYAKHAEHSLTYLNSLRSKTDIVKTSWN